MAVDKDIIKLIMAEGYKTNEAIQDALAEFLEIVEEENEEMAEGVEENDPAQVEDDEDDD
jgi:hypothetical protein